MNKLLCCLVLALPLRHLSVTSGYGFRVHPVTGRFSFHAGVDLRACRDTVFAVTGGTVLAGYNALLGNYLRVSSADLIITYGHLSQLFCLSGDSVATGQPLAVTGSTGRVTGEHLHVGIYWHGRSVDPLLFLLHK